MNAAAQTIPPPGEIEDFIECCDVHAWFHRQGWISLHTAVDNLQRLAERWGLIDLHGQDEIQAQMAFAFGWVGIDEIPSDRAVQLVRQWELADPRDRWRHTGELPPWSEPDVPVKRYSTDRLRSRVGVGDMTVSATTAINAQPFQFGCALSGRPTVPQPCNHAPIEIGCAGCAPSRARQLAPLVPQLRSAGAALSLRSRFAERTAP